MTALADGSAETFQAVAGGIESLTTAAGVVVGGFWAYRKFIRQRQGKPKCLISHQVSHRRMTGGRIVLSIDVVLANKGDALIEIRRVVLLIKQIIPPPANLLVGIETGAEVSGWPVIASSASPTGELFSLLEPGEEAATHLDFILDASIGSVAVYTHCQDRTQVGGNIGWERTTIYDMPLPRRERRKKTAKEAPNEQQAAEVRPGTANKDVVARPHSGENGAHD